MSPHPENDSLLRTLCHPVNLFNNLQFFDDMVERCKRHGYEVLEFDCREFKNQDDIYNAIFHAGGILERDYFYKNLNSRQFEEDLRRLNLLKQAKSAMALRYFDAFQRLEPDCAQDLLRILAKVHYNSLLEGRRLLICAHSEDESLKLEPVLVINAGWNKNRSFSLESDLELEKSKKLKVWWNALIVSINQDNPHPLEPGRTLPVVRQFLGKERLLNLEPPYLSKAEVLDILSQNEAAKAWWNDVMQSFQASPDLPLCHFGSMVKHALGFNSFIRFHQAGLSQGELLSTMERVQAAFLDRQRQRKTQDENYVQWHARVQEILNAESETSKSMKQITMGLGFIGHNGPQCPEYTSPAPEEAAQLLRSLTPEVWKRLAHGTTRVKIEDKDLDL